MKTKPTYQKLENEVKKLREKLSKTKSEDYFKELLKNNTDAFVVIDIHGNNIFQSEPNSTILGYTPKERIGKNVFELIHPDDRNKLMKAMKAGIKKPGIIEKISFRAYHKNGSIKYLEGAAKNMLYSPIVNGIIINYRDVTDRKKAEQALKQRENYLTALNTTTVILQTGELKIQLQKFIETIGQAAHASRTYIFKKHKDKNNNLLLSKITEYAAPGIKPEIDNPQWQNLAYVEWFPRWEKILSEGNIVNGKVADFPQTIKDILQLIDIKAILLIPIMIGEEFWGVIGFDNCKNDNEWLKIEIEFLKASAQKISYKIEKQREQNQRENESKRFIATMNSIDAGVYVADRQTYELLFLNENLKKVFGDKVGEKCYKALQGLEKPCDFCTNDKLLDKNGKPNKPYVWEFQNRITKQWNQCRDQAIQWTNGRLVRLEIATDINDIKKAEQALKASEKKYKQLSYQFQLMADNIPDLVWAKDLDGNFTFVNKAVCDKLLIAKDTKEPIGKNDVFFVMRQRNLHPERNDWHTFGELCINSDDVVIKSKKPGRFDEYGNVNGEFLYLDVSKAPIFDETGKMIGTVGNGRIVTKEKAAEKALKESENRLKQAEKIAHLGSWELNLTNNVLIWSDEVFRIFETKPQEFDATYEAFLDYIHPDDRKKVDEAYTNSLKAKINYEIEHRLLLKNGKIKYVLEKCRTEYDDTGKPIRSIGTVSDITERKLAEERLIESEKRFRKIFNNNATIMLLIDPESGAITDANNAAQVFYGYSHQQLCNLKIHEINQLLNNEVDNEIQNAKNELRNYFIFSHKLKDGQIRTVEVRSTPLEINNKKILFSIIQDITERKLAEEKLKEKEIFLKTIFDGIQEPMHVIDRNFKVLLTNKKLLETKNVKQEDIRGKYCYEAYQGRNEHCEQCGAKEVFKTGKPYSLTKSLPLPDETSGYFEVYSFPLLEENGEVDQIIELTRDITEQKQAEQELIKAREKAEESDRLKSAFLANMSHEIRTPMNGILGFADLLKEAELTGDDQQKYIGIIEKSGKRMLNIINDIIDISKIEVGLMKFDIEETNVNEQIEYTYTFFKPEAEAKGIELSFKHPLSAKKATIKTDREKLYAILTNLVKNAIKYTNEGTIEFGYNLKKANEAAELEFYVKDTGIGIPENRQEAIFDRFIQADIADKMARQGAGLGLAITKAYIEKLGGKIWVESHEGNRPDGQAGGSTFYFTLPYNPEATTEIDQPPVLSEKNETILNLKILIAEDDEVSEMLINHYIKPFGEEILYATTGIEAVEACRNHPDIDLVLMDIRMPEMNGYQATKQIREFNREVIIIAQTAFGLAGDREKALEAGCNDYISKPIKKSELQAMIRKYFGK